MTMQMRMFWILGCLAALAGCQQPTTEPKTVDSWMVETVNDIAVQNAVVRQQTLFPYHFTIDGAALNDLGRQDLAILTAHYKENPGRLSIRQGTVSKDLYDARVAFVLEALHEGGVDTDKVKVVDAPAQGDGLPADRVIVFYKKSMEPVSPLAKDDSAGGGMPGAGAGMPAAPSQTPPGETK